MRHGRAIAGGVNVLLGVCLSVLLEAHELRADVRGEREVVTGSHLECC